MKSMMSVILFLNSTFLFAQGAPGAAGQPEPQNPIFSFVPFLVIFFIFYFLMIRPQKKKIDMEQKYLASLKKNDEIYTKSGVIGTICGLTDKIVTLEIAEGVKIKMLRNQIAGASKDLFETKPAAETKVITAKAK